MKKTIICLLLINLSLNAQSSDSPTKYPLDEFPKYFKQGTLNWGVDCEHFKFNENGTFTYKFTGDCKGWGRSIKGKWTKGNDRIILSAKMTEGPSEEKNHCGGSYYHTNTKKEKNECIKKYKTGILKSFKVYPAIFDLNGFITLDENQKTTVTIKTKLINNEKLKNKEGFLNIDADKFGSFDEHSIEY
ncbi:hypothetical protein JWG41_16430 [Leptospira sp. 201903075]|uniref:hypothetical protein n=1 Tax=Leptospira chreensis TaxID=2810035 RepID=UPI001966AF25|nr:hypothetical protein [Leptospira chreensis]MBM9592037.1 hypothetical protein [Leptospira chreensis]